MENIQAAVNNLSVCYIKTTGLATKQLIGEKQQIAA